MSKTYYILVLLGITLLTILGYWNIWNAFFQQDEWAGFGNFYSYAGNSHIEKVISLYGDVFKSGWGHLLLVTPLVNYIKITYLGIYYPFYIILSLLMHIIASFLLFIFVLKISKNRNISLISTILFVTSASISQAVSWVGTSIPTLLAAIFSLFSLYLWITWLENKKAYVLLLSIVTLILAINAKETALFLIPLLPCIGMMYNFKKFRKYFFLFGIGGVIYLLLRIFLLLFSSHNSSGATEDISLLLFKNFIFVSLFPFAQIVVPQPFWVEILSLLNLIHLPNEIKIENYMRLIYASIFLSFTIIFIRAVKREKNELVKRLYKIGAFIFITGLSPLILLPHTEVSSLFFPSRNLYIPSLGVYLLIATYFYMNKSWGKVIIPIIISIQLFSLFTINQQLIKDGQERRHILNKIKSEVPSLPQKAIFYTESDTSYYGLPLEYKILPFQSGFGQTLLVWYQDREHFQKEFFKNNYLWNITDQGYKEYNNQGFGYFRDYKLMKETIKTYNLSPESVISYSWNSRTNKLQNITNEVRSKLKKDLDEENK